MVDKHYICHKVIINDKCYYRSEWLKKALHIMMEYRHPVYYNLWFILTYARHWDKVFDFFVLKILSFWNNKYFTTIC